ncbi:MAG: magnesium transporter [Rariglobus sp.]|jgi:magnesium transporter|nr:magnesium transporter [Rariglobus sp.]
MITTLLYRDHKFQGQNPPLESLAALRIEPNVMLWVDLSDPTPAEIKAIFEELFAFHPLVIEDCVGDSPLPKLESYDDYLYFVMHAVDYSKTDKFTTTELDLILGKNFLVTFHRQPLKPVQAALDRCLRMPGVPVRGPDRFAHTLLDLMVDAYKPALEELRGEIEWIESAVLANVHSRELFPRVVALRKELAQLRQIVRPQREVASELAQGKARLIRATILPYLRDLAEDLAHIENQAVSWADQLILSFRVYLNKSSHEANQGIRVLTALTALTIPPLLIGGWFGMNFAHMTELDNRYSYPLAAILTLASIGAMAFFMRKRRWL